MIKKRRILAIDDSIIAIKQLQNILERMYEFKGVTSGLAALKYLEDDQKVDLILLDLEMPIMDGFATLTAIHQRDRFKDIPVIILTGNSHKPKVIRGITSGAVGYIVKPADSEQLMEKIEACFKKEDPNLLS